MLIFQVTDKKLANWPPNIIMNQPERFNKSSPHSMNKPTLKETSTSSWGKNLLLPTAFRQRVCLSAGVYLLVGGGGRGSGSLRPSGQRPSPRDVVNNYFHASYLNACLFVEIFYRKLHENYTN